MTDAITTYSPEEYSTRLVELTDDLLVARQRVEIACLARDRAMESLARHLSVPSGEERHAVVGDSIVCVSRSGDRYAVRVFAVDARG
jgi:hypothetical protein